jgi:hypothetical protein
MKNTLKIAGMLLILLVTGLNLEAQRGMRGFRNDTISMKQRHDSLGMQMHGRRMSPMGNNAWMAPGMGQRGMWNGDFGYGRRMGPGMNHRGMRQPGFQGGNRSGMMAYGRGRGPMMNDAPGRRIMESMPGVTTKQKDELAKLNEQQTQEMKTLREKHQEAIKALRDDHQKKVQALLTDEQKKWLRDNATEGRSR